MQLPLLIGDQRRLVLLLLSLPQQPLLVRLDAPTSASTGVYKINWNWKRLKMELNESPCQHFIQCLAVQRMLVLLSYRIVSPSLIGRIRRKEDRTNWIGERKSKSSNYALTWWNAYMRNHDIPGLSRKKLKTIIRKEFYPIGFEED